MFFFFGTNMKIKAREELILNKNDEGYLRNMHIQKEFLSGIG